MSKELYVRDVMSKPITIAKSAVITEALDKMLDEGIDPLIVTNNGTVMGTISRAAIAETLGSKKTTAVPPTKIHVANKTDENFTPAYSDQDAEILIPLLQEFKIVVVLDEEHHLLGKVTAIDLLRHMVPDTTIEKVMQVAHTIHQEERVVHLRRRMIDEGITKFVVTDESAVLGIVTETDMARAMKAFREVVDEKHQDHRIRNLLVRDIMTSPALTVDFDEQISSVVEMLVGKNISALPVLREGKISGLVTKDSLLVAL